MTTCVPARPGPPRSRPSEADRAACADALGRDGERQACARLQHHLADRGRRGVQRVRAIVDTDPSRTARPRHVGEGAVGVRHDLTDDPRPAARPTRGRRHVQRRPDDRRARRASISRPAIERVRPYARRSRSGARSPTRRTTPRTSRTDCPGPVRHAAVADLDLDRRRERPVPRRVGQRHLDRVRPLEICVVSSVIVRSSVNGHGTGATNGRVQVLEPAGWAAPASDLPVDDEADRRRCRRRGPPRRR